MLFEEWPSPPGGYGSPASASSSGGGGGKGGGQDAGSMTGEGGGAMARAWRDQIRGVWMEKAPDVPFRVFAEVLREHAGLLTGVRAGSVESDRSYLRRCFASSGLATFDQFMAKIIESVGNLDSDLAEEMNKHTIQEETMEKTSCRRVTEP